MNIIYAVITGSHAYGTATETSDLDIRGVFLPTERQLLGFEPVQSVSRTEPHDVTYYPLRQFAEMALSANPNILELLFVEREHILRMDPLGEELRKAREAFLSRRIYRSYRGFAHTVRKRLEGKKPPSALRNSLIETHGYDTKEAAHLIRVLRTGLEAVKAGHFRTFRPEGERDELLAIRAGKVPLEKVLLLADALEKELDEALSRSPLPEEPDAERVENLIIRLHRRAVFPGAATA